MGENPRGQRYECTVPSEAVSYLCRRLAGRRVSAEQAGKTLQPVAESFNLPYTYGDKLRFSGQYVLIAAVALGRATVVKEGRILRVLGSVGARASASFHSHFV